MEFMHGNDWCRLRGDREAVQLMDSKGVAKLTSKSNVTYLLQCWLVQVERMSIEQKITQFIHPDLLDLIDEYHDLFEEPKSLPPIRDHDHSIHLKEGTHPIKLRPYRHSITQKNVLEYMITEMLRQGTTRPSHSPFSSPVVLV